MTLEALMDIESMAEAVSVAVSATVSATVSAGAERLTPAAAHYRES